MAIKESVPLDLKTVNVLKEVLEDAWYSKTVLAERILVSAANGKRDRERLLAVALEAA